MRNWEYDLVVLVPDKNMESALQGLLSRPEALRSRPVRFKNHVDPEGDPGCARNGHNFSRSMSRTCNHALIMFDYEGCGREGHQPATLEKAVALNLPHPCSTRRISSSGSIWCTHHASLHSRSAVR